MVEAPVTTAWEPEQKSHCFALPQFKSTKNEWMLRLDNFLLREDGVGIQEVNESDLESMEKIGQNQGNKKKAQLYLSLNSSCAAWGKLLSLSEPPFHLMGCCKVEMR